MQNIYLLRPAIQHYAWGGYDYIPQLLSIDNAQQKPFAEIWLGTHPKGMAEVRVGQDWQSLQEFIQQDPFALLGTSVAHRFQERLPFLFKVLDVRRMLSIQSHPDKATAKRGFAREDALGIPRNAPKRTYRDDNHKPEIMVALSDFWLLHGFRDSVAIAQTLEDIPGWKPLSPFLHNGGIKALYQHIMEMDQQDVDRLLQPMAEHLRKQSFSESDRNTPHYWARQALDDYSQDGHMDRGIFSIYWLNLVSLLEGEGIFQDSGVPHAYLEGVNVELMANSDNVFRGGLTPKHIDVKELLENLHFDPVEPKILKGEILQSEKIYPSPVDDFTLSSCSLSANETFKHQATSGPSIYLLIEGILNQDTSSENFKQGDAFLIPAGQEASMLAQSNSLLFKATA